MSINKYLFYLKKYSTASAEDNESKYYRLISNCLQGLTLLISSLSNSSISEIESIINSIISDNKFWKFAKSKDPLVSLETYTDIVLNINKSYRYVC